MNYLQILVSFLLVRGFTQSECLVSEWGTWSKCHGGCQRGLIVRNRDVLQPPLQELTEEGRMMQRLCPHLYETKYCDKLECEAEKQAKAAMQLDPPNLVNENSNGMDVKVAPSGESASSLVERQMKKVGFGRDVDDRTQAAIKQKFISETEQLFKLDDAISRRYGPQPSDNLVNTNTPIIDISTQQITNKQWRDNTATRYTFPTSSTPTPSYREHLQSFGRAEGSPTYTTTASHSGYPYRLQSINSRKNRPISDHSVSNLLRKIEQALDTNQPLDEKYIKSAMKRNRKLSKILVDAYKQRQNLMNSGSLSSSSATLPTVISPYPPSSTTTEAPAFVTDGTTTAAFVERRHPTITTTTVAPETTTTFIASEPETPESKTLEDIVATTPDFFESHPTTTSSLLYWPKTGGYVPNTRKHASEITAQLYMTNEIVQTLADDPLPLDTNPECEVNKRCCKIIKNTCSDGVDPKFVKRWYRPKGSNICLPYHYPRCSSMEEMEELPILFEQNCQDLCFSQSEKRIAPLFLLESEDE
ncbi:hypothetical protein CAEBREN_15886 [Caenorhabditis brenneri]|uniref:Uncharacterized protein n=1 Tax=Caenorhabditis brenneri TaxID=135651 RepID=G0N221_CAEBE|nr:hypothetical protein CAEBREN_15886 [Caenorhabditis brenneri]